MIVHITYKLHCTRCTREYEEGFDSEEDLLHYAKEAGWVQRRVQNGSLWEFCPFCKYK